MRPYSTHTDGIPAVAATHVRWQLIRSGCRQSSSRSQRSPGPLLKGPSSQNATTSPSSMSVRPSIARSPTMAGPASNTSTAAIPATQISARFAFAPLVRSVNPPQRAVGTRTMAHAIRPVELFSLSGLAAR